MAMAQQVASMSADEAYARATAMMLERFGKLEAQMKAGAAETSDLKQQLAAAQAALKSLSAGAKANDPVAKQALNDFAQGRDEKGFDALEAGAKAKAAAALQDWKRIGALAFAVDTKRALNAYEEALKLAPGDLDALNQVSGLKFRLGDLAGAEAGLRAVSVASGADKSWQAAALGNLGEIARTRGDLAAAEDYQKRALSLNTEVGHKEGQAASLNNLGIIARLRRDLAGAENYQKRSLALNTELGGKEGQAANLGNLGNIAYTRGDLAAAEDYLKRTLALFTELGSKEGQAGTLGNLGIIAQTRGDLAAAEDYQKRALALNTELGGKEGQANNLNNLGQIARGRGRSSEACGFYRRSLALFEGMGAGAAQNAGITRNNIAQVCPR
jgi:tetratricopeptide (TPR) repeat protein